MNLEIPGEKNEMNASGQSWNSALHSAAKGPWKGPLAAKPIDWSDGSD